MSWRGALIALGLVLALAVVNFAIVSRERLLAEGEVVLLELAPVDPRSLMQGDYMSLRFAIEDDLRSALGDPSWARDAHRDGYAVLALAPDHTVRFVREQASSEPVGEGEIALRYRLRSGELRIVTNAYFFPEGQAARYEHARFGELRVGTDGEALLTRMRAADLRPIE